MTCDWWQGSGTLAMLPFTSMHRCTVIQWLQRNAALDYIEEQRLDGVVVFTDDRHSHTPEVCHTALNTVQYCPIRMDMMLLLPSVE